MDKRLRYLPVSDRPMARKTKGRQEARLPPRKAGERKPDPAKISDILFCGDQHATKLQVKLVPLAQLYAPPYAPRELRWRRDTAIGHL